MNDQKIAESRIRYEKELAEKKARVQFIIEDGNNLTDDDGYPTDLALEAIEKWHWDDPKGWFEFIGSLWAYKSWGWSEEDVPHEWNKVEQYKDKIVHRYDISTAGWSGNESIIRAMQANEMMWHLQWVQSRRGGHYIFELYEVKD